MIFSVVAEKTVMLCREALPDDFLRLLAARRCETIEIPAEAVFSGSGNVLALGDGKVLSFKESKVVNEKLRAAGFEVFDPPLSQFVASGTGPHCLSFELVRDRN
jgi:N-dimethylarginine dimethylaminohydrolase